MTTLVEVELTRVDGQNGKSSGSILQLDAKDIKDPSMNNELLVLSHCFGNVDDFGSRDSSKLVHAAS